MGWDVSFHPILLGCIDDKWSGILWSLLFSEANTGSCGFCPEYVWLSVVWFSINYRQSAAAKWCALASFNDGIYWLLFSWNKLPGLSNFTQRSRQSTNWDAVIDWSDGGFIDCVASSEGVAKLFPFAEQYSTRLWHMAKFSKKLTKRHLPNWWSGLFGNRFVWWTVSAH